MTKEKSVSSASGAYPTALTKWPNITPVAKEQPVIGPNPMLKPNTFMALTKTLYKFINLYYFLVTHNKVNNCILFYK